MKLFLTSLAISPEQASDFFSLVGKRPSDVRFALIENAADVERSPESWLQANRDTFKSIGINATHVNLKDFDSKDAIEDALKDYDVIWLGGGNTFYLRWLLRETGADEVIKNLVYKGKVYGGGSAGALVAGPTLRHLEAADDPSKAPEQIEDGLALTNVVVIPHWGDEKYGPIVADVEKKLKYDGFTTMHITDSQVVMIHGDKIYGPVK